MQIEAEKAVENRKTIYILEPSNEKENNLIKGKNKQISGDNQKKINEEKNRFNNEYIKYLTQDKLMRKYEETKDNSHLKDFYEYQLHQINDDIDIFSNKGLIEVLNEECFSQETNQITIKYIKIFFI